MSAVSESLSRLENEHQVILDEVHELRKKSTLDDGDLDIVEALEDIVRDWDRIFGGSAASDTIGSKLEEVRSSNNPSEKIKELDLLVDPLRHYVIGLEKLQREEYRDSVTRSAMVIERIVTELAIELGVDVENVSMESAFGKIQNPLEASDISRGDIFVSDMRSVYTIRNDRGPHDVPAAEQIQAKRSISELMWIYYRYLQIVSQIGSTDLPKEDIEDFTNLLDVLLPVKPSLVMGEGGGEPSVRDILVNDLYKSGFFEEGKILGEVEEKLNSKRYNFPKPTVSDNLRRLTGEVLTRKGSRGSYRYVEKVPPEDYFE